MFAANCCHSEGWSGRNAALMRVANASCHWVIAGHANMKRLQFKLSVRSNEVYGACWRLDVPSSGWGKP